jgi:hypothetical protein
MSRWTVLRFVSSAILSVLFNGSVAARMPDPRRIDGCWLQEAPMPQTRCAAPSECSAPTGQLSGTWYRELDGMVIAATFSGSELTMCLCQNADGAMARATFIADYSITKEGVVHGVKTGVDVDLK